MTTSIKWLLNISFMAIGIIGNIIGPLLPTIKDEINMSYSQSGLLLSELFIGGTIVGIIGGYLMDKYGKKKFLLTGNILMIIGLIGTILSKGFDFLYAANFLTALGFGTYVVGINALCADYSGEAKGNDMNFLHFFFGIGAISGPIIVLLSVNYIKNWRVSFLIALAFCIVSGLMLFRARLKNKVAQAESLSHRKESSSLPLKNSALWAAGAAIFFYVGVETSIAGWIPEFWKQFGSTELLAPSLATTIFWLSITMVRLFTGKIADSIGLVKFIVIASIGAMIVSVSWIVLPSGPWTIANIIIVGLFLSGLYPNIMAYSNSLFPGKTGTVSSFISVIGSLGGFLVPTLIGRLSDLHGIGLLSISIFVLLVLVALFSVLLWLVSTRKKQA